MNRAVVLAVLMLTGLTPALAQPAPGAQDRRPEAAPARAQPEAPFTTRGPFTVMSGSTFRVRGETYQIADLRAPRARTGSCTYERLRGREARKRLRRILRGEVVITPTGQVSTLGYRQARVTVGGRDVRRAMIDAGVALPRRPGQVTNPWCL